MNGDDDIDESASTQCNRLRPPKEQDTASQLATFCPARSLHSIYTMSSGRDVSDGQRQVRQTSRQVGAVISDPSRMCGPRPRTSTWTRMSGCHPLSDLVITTGVLSSTMDHNGVCTRLTTHRKRYVIRALQQTRKVLQTSCTCQTCAQPLSVTTCISLTRQTSPDS
jgi:hypothetical protein